MPFGGTPCSTFVPTSSCTTTFISSPVYVSPPVLTLFVLLLPILSFFLPSQLFLRGAPRALDSPPAADVDVVFGPLRPTHTAPAPATPKPAAGGRGAKSEAGATDNFWDNGNRGKSERREVRDPLRMGGGLPPHVQQEAVFAHCNTTLVLLARAHVCVCVVMVPMGTGRPLHTPRGCPQLRVERDRGHPTRATTCVVVRLGCQPARSPLLSRLKCFAK